MRSGSKEESIQTAACLPYFRTWILVDLQSRDSTGHDKYYLHKVHNKPFEAINKQLCCSYQLTRKRDCWGYQLLMVKCLRQLCRLLTWPPHIPSNITLQLPTLPFRTAISKQKNLSCCYEWTDDLLSHKEQPNACKRGDWEEPSRTICLWISKILHFQMSSTFKLNKTTFSNQGSPSKKSYHIS